MKPIKKIVYKKRTGAALILSMIFVLIFSALAVSMAAMSGTNVQIADNQRKVSTAFASAESGLEVMRYWLSRVSLPGSTAPNQVLSTVAASLQSDLAANSISNITVNYDGSKITIPSVTLATAENISFTVELRQLDNDTLQMDVTGRYRQITRTIRVNYILEPQRFPIFDFGLATKGPLRFFDNTNIVGTNSYREADIYIESANENLALLATDNANFDGDFSIANSNASVDFQDTVVIAGESGQSAIDNHIFIGIEPAQFPVPNTAHFRQYATGDIIDLSTNINDNMTLTNAIIKAGTNPSFLGNITINGILFIESPNIVTFEDTVDVQGLIVADGDVNNPGTNKITIRDDFGAGSFPPDAQFDVMRSETGSSILAPGFELHVTDNFTASGGVVAASGAYFSDNIHVVVKGSIINYSENPMTIGDNVTLQFDRSGTVEFPAGFEHHRLLKYDPSSYSEVIL